MDMIQTGQPFTAPQPPPNAGGSSAGGMTNQGNTDTYKPWEAPPANSPGGYSLVGDISNQPTTDSFTPSHLANPSRPVASFPVTLRYPTASQPNVSTTNGFRPISGYVGPDGQLYLPAGAALSAQPAQTSPTNITENPPVTTNSAAPNGTAQPSDSNDHLEHKPKAPTSGELPTEKADSSVNEGTNHTENTQPETKDKAPKADAESQAPAGTDNRTPASEAGETAKSNTTTKSPQDTEALTDEQKAIGEFQEAYAALEDSLQDEDVQQFVRTMLSYVQNPFKIFTSPFKFLRTTRQLWKDDKIVELRKQIMDLRPYWDNLKTKLPDLESVTSSRPTRHQHRHKPTTDDEPIRIPFDELSPSELAALLSS